MGGGYSLRVHDDFNPDVGPWVVTGNRIVSGSYTGGAVDTTNTNCSTTTWSDNRLVTIDSSYRVTSLGSAVNCGGGTSTPPPTTTPAPTAPTNVRVIR
jgi:hypothetical protein